MCVLSHITCGGLNDLPGKTIHIEPLINPVLHTTHNHFEWWHWLNGFQRSNNPLTSQTSAAPTSDLCCAETTTLEPSVIVTTEDTGIHWLQFKLIAFQLQEKHPDVTVKWAITFWKSSFVMTVWSSLVCVFCFVLIYKVKKCQYNQV